MRKTILNSLAALAALAVVAGVQAQLTLTFDTVAETFKLSGSGSGTPGNSGSFPGFGYWHFERTDATPTIPGSTFVNYNDDAMFTSLFSTPGNGAWDVQLNLFVPGSGTRMALELGLSDQTPTTIEGTGVFRSYAGLSSEAKSYISGLNGLTLSVNTSIYGGSWSGGPVNISVVPEPSTYAVIAGLGLVGFAGYRRCRTRA